MFNKLSIITSVIISVIITSLSVYAAGNLWEFYSQQGKKIPSLEERKPIYLNVAQDEYRGTAIQNDKLLHYLQNYNSIVSPSNNPPTTDLQFGATTQFVGGKPYYLYGSGVGTTDTSVTLTALKRIISDINLTMSDVGTTGYATIEPGNNTRQEFISFTGITQNSDGTATLTGVTRGLSDVSPYTASTTLQKAHAGGTILVLSNSPAFYEGFGIKANNELIGGIWTFTTAPREGNATNSTSTSQFATRGYADNIANAGAATSTESNGGIVELATRTEMASGTASTVPKPLVLQAQHATSTPGLNIRASGGTGETYLVSTQDDGTINEFFFGNIRGTLATTTSATTTQFSVTTLANLGTTTNLGTFSISSTTGTSTSANGFNLTSGCYATNGVCQKMRMATSSTNQIASSSPQECTASATFVELKSVIIPADGEYTFQFGLSRAGASEVDAAIFRNGVQVGPSVSSGSPSPQIVVFSHNITGWSAGDTASFSAFTEGGTNACLQNAIVKGILIPSMTFLNP